MTPDPDPLHPGPGSSPPSPEGGLAHSASAHASIPGSGNSKVKLGHSENKQNLLPKLASPGSPPLLLQHPPKPSPSLPPPPVGQLQPSWTEGLGAARAFRLPSAEAVTAAAGRES